MTTNRDAEAARENRISLICNGSAAVLMLIAIGLLIASVPAAAGIVGVLAIIQFMQGTKHATEARRIRRS